MLLPQPATHRSPILKAPSWGAACGGFRASKMLHPTVTLSFARSICRKPVVTRERIGAPAWTSRRRAVAPGRKENASATTDPPPALRDRSWSGRGPLPRRTCGMGVPPIAKWAGRECMDCTCNEIQWSTVEHTVNPPWKKRGTTCFIMFLYSYSFQIQEVSTLSIAERYRSSLH